MNSRRPARLSSILLSLVMGTCGGCKGDEGPDCVVHVSGYVVDNGLLQPEATVTAVDADGEEQVAIADDWGEYALELPYGDYTLKASASCRDGEVDLELDDCDDRVQDIPVRSNCN
jgi:hypothetical protein